MSTARSSSARSPSCSTGCCRSRSWAGRASPTATSATPARCSTPRPRDSTPILVLGRAADADVLLRAIESGAVTKIRPVGILSPSPADRGQAIRGISVLGDLDDIERVVADLRQSRHQRDAARAHAERARAGSEAGNDPDAGAAARARDQPAAVARRRRRGAAACAGQRRGPAAAAEREDRLPPARDLREGQVDHRHRRRRLDRRRNLRSHRHLRRGARAGDRELGAGAARGAGDAGDQAAPARRSKAASPTSATATASSA